MKRERYDRARLLFRRQFVLGPRFVDTLAKWQRIEVKPSVRLTVHPDLPVVHASDGSASIVLLGYMLDPFRARATDADILAELLPKARGGESPRAFIRATHALGGRWALVVDNGRDSWLFHDPCGYRQVFYTTGMSDGPWCASQPGLLAELLGLSLDKEAVSFIRTYRRRNPQYWWPVDSSPYAEVLRLLPNHYLDLKEGRSHRFWPDRDLAPRTTDEVAAENAEVLQGLIRSAAHRYDLALSITAGADTRLLLAASRPVAGEIYCFTMMYWDMNERTPDVWIPARLLGRLGLRHHLIPCPSHMDPEFRRIYERNVSFARLAYGTIAQGLYENYPANKLCLKGNAIPAVVPYYRERLRRHRPEMDGRELDAKVLAYLTKRQEAFAMQAFDRWLSTVPSTNIDALILFGWEDREGSWQATSQLEWDMVQEVLAPFNCRLFLENLLCVPESDRKKPPHVAHRKMIHRLWPEALAEPINPRVERTFTSIAREYLLRPGERDWQWLQSRALAAWRNRRS